MYQRQLNRVLSERIPNNFTVGKPSFANKQHSLSDDLKCILFASVKWALCCFFLLHLTAHDWAMSEIQGI